MVQKDGEESELFFINFCKSTHLKYKQIHHPFDFIVNGQILDFQSKLIERFDAYTPYSIPSD